jgi:transposase InsO family protein
LEKHPEARPRIINNNGPQFIAKDFKEFIRFGGLTHLRTSPYYPQSNGKLERWHGVLKQECIRPSSPMRRPSPAGRLQVALIQPSNFRLPLNKDSITH